MSEVVPKKMKIDDRKRLLAQLKEHQLNPDQMAQLYSTSTMQTRGLKKFTADTNGFSKTTTNSLPIDRHATKVRWRRRLKHRLAEQVSKVSSSEDTDDVSSDESHSDPQVASHDLHIQTSFVSDISTDTLNQDKNKHSPPCSDITNREFLHESLSTQHIAKQNEILKNVASEKLNPAIFVHVNRSPEIEKSRLELPIIGEEQCIIETIRYNDVVVLSGQTGSGKTTQIPQFLYEAGYALNGKIIGVTEPRRVAAISMSERVGRELNLEEEVSYQIRFAGNVTEKTKIKFMTDGVLLRECRRDFLLTKYSVLIIDEAHERSIFSDILIGLLSRIVPMRAKRGIPLKLVIMSATLRVSDFIDNKYLFKQPPPLISVDARQFPVQLHFAKTTPDNYLVAAYKKACSVHTKMPRGGILIFVTSQLDVKCLCRKLKQKFPKTSKEPLHCLGLYAMLPLEKQRLVFKNPPDNHRLCVVATNVAETSITIPNIKYVIDTGLEKRKVYNMTTGVSRFITTWTSKSSAEQRMGRAGRTAPGHCFRLFSSAVFTNDFPDFSQPQILQKPVEDVLLQMKCMNIDNVVNFPFPTRPSLEALISAEKLLVNLGALDDTKAREARFIDMNKTEFSSIPTQLGKAMSNFPVGPRCAKMIVHSTKRVLPHVITLVSALTVREIFLGDNNVRNKKKELASCGERKLLGDFLVMIRAIQMVETFNFNSSKCVDLGLRPKGMKEFDKMRKQLIVEINNKKTKTCLDVRAMSKKPTKEQCKVLRQLLLGSFRDHIARKLPNGELLKRSKEDPNETKKIRIKNAYECKDHNGPVYISTESVLRGQHPECIIYKELYEGDNKKMYMRDVAVVDPSWLNDD